MKLYHIHGSHDAGYEPDIDWFVTAETPKEALDLYKPYIEEEWGVTVEHAAVRLIADPSPFPHGVNNWVEPALEWSHDE